MSEIQHYFSMRAGLVVFLSIAAITNTVIVHAQGRNPYVPAEAFYDYEPHPDFIYQVIAQTVVSIEGRENTNGECHTVDVAINNETTRRYAFALVPDAVAERWTWLAVGAECGERSVSPENVMADWEIPLDEPRPDFVYKVIGESITEIKDTEYLRTGTQFRVTALIVETHNCVLILSQSPIDVKHHYEWQLGGLECSDAPMPADDNQAKGAD